MSSSSRDSVVLIGSRNSSRFGSGFIVAHDDQGSYILTCAHVITMVGGASQVTIDNQPDRQVTLTACGLSMGIDLAVIYVQGLTDRPVLKLTPDAEACRAVTISGFKLHTPQSQILRTIHALLGDQVYLQSRGATVRTPAWDLLIAEHDQLADGYSGSPVVDRQSGLVLAITSHLEQEGRRGQAISVQALRSVWPNLPPHIMVHREVEALYTNDNGHQTQSRWLATWLEVWGARSPPHQLWKEASVQAYSNPCRI